VSVTFVDLTVPAALQVALTLLATLDQSALSQTALDLLKSSNGFAASKADHSVNRSVVITTPGKLRLDRGREN
jgi:hypothetical protein